MGCTLEGKHLVLGVTGGIAAYKSVELLRLLVKEGASVRVVVTENATRFVGPMTFEALSQRQVCRNLFASTDDASVQHIHWAEEAEGVVIAPATANIIGKLANGIADDALSTFMLAVTCPVLICPAMNSNMYASRQVQRNLTLLRDYGYTVLEPGSGELACGTTGPGRLPEPPIIRDALETLLAPKDFQGRRLLISAGPTREAIDPVRFITNPSSGKMGYAIARAAAMRGAVVTLVTGPTALTLPADVTCVPVTSAAEMATEVLERLEDADIIIKTAAVADFRPATAASRKVKKETADLNLPLERTQDILKALGERKGGRILVGFAAETHELDRFAAGKREAKNLDMIVGNLIGGADAGFGADTNRATFYFKDGRRETVDLMTKQALAHLLLDRVGRLMR
ncbi:bifunctional phosphopantothenoylcysteine decarboxylase/phosphopantothenate--cysteine ligase CoaBC [Desulfatitalea alkaliphila]|uniref:Coenzyme A biosynthesis bifunctional protein CoaBC n=1 Tax=Desulfatitalea alkaliphila TaxID=2929485 RepID=A0AA41R7S7_9BACT|nr:bifunctional phosphopantothenoylcysteine decarboxylase/phosphopantothenate--cysteine ligase CoaBC [Desulfatitalea alkaliphila]MCJ8502556.1 bifunctional phosphopantothenoylcysteine decarboxylase/phosphopantothenate--cysteine ligase CoaBC [Desulfatitalea alkaliphila]